ncbi:MAG TPA: hypothetical protein VGC77_11150 [Rhodopseudomonas sp.]
MTVLLPTRAFDYHLTHRKKTRGFALRKRERHRRSDLEVCRWDRASLEK